MFTDWWLQDDRKRRYPTIAQAKQVYKQYLISLLENRGINAGSSLAIEELEDMLNRVLPQISLGDITLDTSGIEAKLEDVKQAITDQTPTLNTEDIVNELAGIKSAIENQPAGGGGGGSGVTLWGGIYGDINTQTDLKAALDSITETGFEEIELLDERLSAIEYVLNISPGEHLPPQWIQPDPVEIEYEVITINADVEDGGQYNDEYIVASTHTNNTFYIIKRDGTVTNGQLYPTYAFFAKTFMVIDNNYVLTAQASKGTPQTIYKAPVTGYTPSSPPEFNMGSVYGTAVQFMLSNNSTAAAPLLPVQLIYLQTTDCVVALALIQNNTTDRCIEWIVAKGIRDNTIWVQSRMFFTLLPDGQTITFKNGSTLDIKVIEDPVMSCITLVKVDGLAYGFIKVLIGEEYKYLKFEINLSQLVWLGVSDTNFKEKTVRYAKGWFYAITEDDLLIRSRDALTWESLHIGTPVASLFYLCEEVFATTKDRESQGMPNYLIRCSDKSAPVVFADGEILYAFEPGYWCTSRDMIAYGNHLLKARIKQPDEG